MTYIEWEAELERCLKSLPQEEVNEIISYYREMHGDKRDAGLSDEEIIKTFGEPMLCASKILMENAGEVEKADEQEKQKDEREKEEENKPPQKEDAVQAQKEEGQQAFSKSAPKVSVAKIVGWFFLAILFIIPLTAVVISVIAALASITVTGAALAVGGVILAIASPFAFFLGYTGLGVLATLGTALATVGIGLFLFVIFFVITKYSIFVCIKILKHFFKRRNRK